MYSSKRRIRVAASSSSNDRKKKTGHFSCNVIVFIAVTVVLFLGGSIYMIIWFMNNSASNQQIATHFVSKDAFDFVPLDLSDTIARNIPLDMKKAKTLQKSLDSLIETENKDNSLQNSPPEAASVKPLIENSIRFISYYGDEINDIVTDVVQCNTTQGSFRIDVRSNWSPKGSKQFLHLVDLGLFQRLPFSRVCPRYITQFGARFHPELLDDSISVIEDDPSLHHKRDMNFGYVFFAGSGRNSRRDELVIALCPKAGCQQTGLGGEPWEVPFGTIPKEDFPVLHRIEQSGRPYPRLEMPGLEPQAQGPNRHRLEREVDYLSQNYPFMEYFSNCWIEARDVRIVREIPGMASITTATTTSTTHSLRGNRQSSGTD